MISIETSLRAIFRDSLGVDEERITPEASISGDLRAFGFDRVEMLMAAEDHFGVEIDDGAWNNCATFGECVALVAATIAEVR